MKPDAAGAPHRRTGRLRKTLLSLNRHLGDWLGVALVRAPVRSPLSQELLRLFEAFEISAVLDVGAHRGGFAQRMREDVGYRAQILSFEPSPETYIELAAIAASDVKWSVYNLALGSADGNAELIEYSGDGQMASIRELSDHAEVYSPGLSVTGRRQVAVRRLDSLWDELGPGLKASRSFLKIDTQGFDLEVIGGVGALLAHLPAVLMEVAVQPLYRGAPVMQDVLGVMEGHGFELTGAFPIHRYANGLRVIEFDCTFVHVNAMHLFQQITEDHRFRLLPVILAPPMQNQALVGFNEEHA